ncbi:hypothetical protein HSTV2_100 [Halorubrum sodomense tailed virus 2]|uniref:Uncharacterized protein n=1 Tax=Halorubrum sodomense tailed virus 2 TaxID=1262527 RepID=L7TND5_9CAUD|nr:hypothetical protein HSTV2_100 [Halorubrum sodomense tailed virus 2]AGC34367.1 hypothetical protein HSTV2_100 [Halorubrum sodomense tailed virus 2]
MNFRDKPFEYQTFAATVASDNGDNAEQQVARELQEVGCNVGEFRILWNEALTTSLTMVTFAVHTAYLQELPKLIERGVAEDIEQVAVVINNE